MAVSTETQYFNVGWDERGAVNNVIKEVYMALKEKGYKLSESLESLKDYNQIKAIMIDHDTKSAHIPSTMVMACYVTCKKKVLSVEEYCQ